MTAITEFFNDRKAAWLKAKVTPNLDEAQQMELQQEAEQRFTLANWLPDAAKRAAQLSMVSHPSKFSHPSAKTSNVIAQTERRNDGYLRSGNVNYELDVFGNAAAMDVYKFLTLLMDDERSVLTHLEEDTEAIQTRLAISTMSYTDIKQGLLSIKQENNQQIKTDRLVKQVYFPVEDNYHLLSLLTPSGLLTKIKSSLDEMRFSEETKLAREARKKNEFHETGFDDIFNLTVTGYGGTQPQNISVLNSKNAGRAYLLSSQPPELIRRTIRLPKTDFFKNTLNPYAFYDSYQSLHKFMLLDLNNVNIRQAITNILYFIIKQVLESVLKIREQGVGWSATDYYQSLPLEQRIWLDNLHLFQRQEQDEWIDKIRTSFAVWIKNNYAYNLKNDSIELSDHELLHIEGFVDTALKQDQEFFK